MNAPAASINVSVIKVLCATADGFQWWIPEGSKGEFDAQGIYDQFIYVDPHKDMVIVKLSSNYHYKKDRKRVFHDLEIALFRKIVEQAK